MLSRPNLENVHEGWRLRRYTNHGLVELLKTRNDLFLNCDTGCEVRAKPSGDVFVFALSGSQGVSIEQVLGMIDESDQKKPAADGYELAVRAYRLPNYKKVSVAAVQFYTLLDKG